MRQVRPSTQALDVHGTNSNLTGTLAEVRHQTSVVQRRSIALLHNLSGDDGTAGHQPNACTRTAAAMPALQSSALWAGAA